MNLETLRKIPFSVIGRCSPGSAPLWLQGKYTKSIIYHRPLRKYLSRDTIPLKWAVYTAGLPYNSHQFSSKCIQFYIAKCLNYYRVAVLILFIIIILLFVFFVSRRDAFAGVEEEEIQSFLYDSDGCYNSSLFQASSVSAMATFENLLNNSTMTHTVGATTTERIKETYLVIVQEGSILGLTLRIMIDK